MPGHGDRVEGSHVQRNRQQWNELSTAYADKAPAQWRSEPNWGVFGIPETEIRLLPEDLAGKDVIELGCGTAYVSSWLARLGARPIGLDLSERQLATAARLQGEFAISFPIVQANAEIVPLRDESFDLAISEYGAAIWCDPYRWIPEAARVLRPGGQLIFLGNSVLFLLLVPETDAEGPVRDRLLRDYFGMYRFEWPDYLGVDFHLGYGDMIRLLRRSGLDVEDLIELRPAEGSKTDWPLVDADWARRWPAEEVWRARKR